MTAQVIPDEELATCNKCQKRPRARGTRMTWCRECKSEWQREYRRGARRQKRIPDPIRVGECLLWQGQLMRNGYGRLNVNGRMQYAHRVAWEREHGPLDAEVTIDHLCCVKACVNVSHLEPVSRGENTRRHYRRLEGAA